MTLDSAFKAYRKQFYDDFPTIPLMRGRTDREVIEMIERCISSKKDVYDLGYLELEDAQY